MHLFRVTAAIGVVGQSQFAVRFLDLSGRGLLLHSQRIVQFLVLRIVILLFGGTAAAATRILVVVVICPNGMRSSHHSGWQRSRSQKETRTSSTGKATSPKEHLGLQHTSQVTRARCEGAGSAEASSDDITQQRHKTSVRTEPQNGFLK